MRFQSGAVLTFKHINIMQKFTIIQSGTSESGRKWAMIGKEAGDLMVTAFVTLTPSSKKTTGDVIEIPNEIAEVIQWKA